MPRQKALTGTSGEPKAPKKRKVDVMEATPKPVTRARRLATPMGKTSKSGRAASKPTDPTPKKKQAVKHPKRKRGQDRQTYRTDQQPRCGT